MKILLPLLYFGSSTPVDNQRAKHTSLPAVSIPTRLAIFTEPASAPEMEGNWMIGDTFTLSPVNTESPSYQLSGRRQNTQSERGAEPSTPSSPVISSTLQRRRTDGSYKKDERWVDPDFNAEISNTITKNLAELAEQKKIQEESDQNFILEQRLITQKKNARREDQPQAAASDKPISGRKKKLKIAPNTPATIAKPKIVEESLPTSLPSTNLQLSPEEKYQQVLHIKTTISELLTQLSEIKGISYSKAQYNFNAYKPRWTLGDLATVTLIDHQDNSEGPLRETKKEEKTEQVIKQKGKNLQGTSFDALRQKVLSENAGNPTEWEKQFEPFLRERGLLPWTEVKAKLPSQDKIEELRQQLTTSGGARFC